MPLPFRSSLCAAALMLVLPSCVLRTNIGKNIREAGEIYTSVGLRPVDGRVYMTPEQRSYKTSCIHYAYARLPEVTYRQHSDLVDAHSILLHKKPSLSDIQPTGRIRVALVKCSALNCPLAVEEMMTDIPANARSYSVGEMPDKASIDIKEQVSTNEAGVGRRIVAAPFDYLIDPALSVCMYVGYGVGAIVVSPFAGIYYLVDSACDQRQIQPSTPTADSE